MFSDYSVDCFGVPLLCRVGTGTGTSCVCVCVCDGRRRRAGGGGRGHVGKRRPDVPRPHTRSPAFMADLFVIMAFKRSRVA